MKCVAACRQPLFLIFLFGCFDTCIECALVQADVDAFVFRQCLAVADDAAVRVGDDAVTAGEYGVRIEMRKAVGQAGELLLPRIQMAAPARRQPFAQCVELAEAFRSARPAEAQTVRQFGECLLPATGLQAQCTVQALPERV